MRNPLVVLTFFVSLSASASSICDSYRTPGQQQQLGNCERAVAKIPNKEALRYTINYLNENRGSLRDPKCAVDGMDRNYDKCIKCRDENWVKSGFENGCSFVMNDLTHPWTKKGERAEGRTTAYYVDLCTKDPSQVVTPFYVNGGKEPRFSDKPDTGTDVRDWNKSTLAGAFKLEPTVYRDFVPTRKESYQGIIQRHGFVPAMRMIGLNSSNNTTEGLKPFHVSAYRTGFGCTGVSESTIPVMQKIVASGGSTLMMAYAGKKFEQHGSCTNDDSDRKYGSSGGLNGAGDMQPTSNGGSSR